MCSPTCCCAMSPIINFVPAFTVSASVINAFFTEGKDAGKKQFLASSACWSGGLDSQFSSWLPRFNSWAENQDLASCHHSLLPHQVQFEFYFKNLLSECDCQEPLTLSGDCFIVLSALPIIFNVMLVKHHKKSLVVTCQFMGEGRLCTITLSCCNSSLPFQESSDIFKPRPSLHLFTVSGLGGSWCQPPPVITPCARHPLLAYLQGSWNSIVALLFTAPKVSPVSQPKPLASSYSLTPPQFIKKLSLSEVIQGHFRMLATKDTESHNIYSEKTTVIFSK